MSLAGAFVGFTLLIWLISALRSRLVFELSSLSLLIFGNTLLGKWVYSLMFLPGTVIHELSHFLTAELLGVRTGKIEVLPDFDSDPHPNESRLGSVQTSQSDPLRSFLIGSAPFTTGLIILWILGSFLSTLPLHSWHLGLTLYAIAVVGSSMMLSKEDRRAWPFILILIIVLVVLYNIFPIPIPRPILDQLLTLFTGLDRVLAVTVGIILGVIGVIYFFRRIIEKMLGKKIIRR